MRPIKTDEDKADCVTSTDPGQRMRLSDLHLHIWTAVCMKLTWSVESTNVIGVQPEWCPFINSPGHPSCVFLHPVLLWLACVHVWIWLGAAVSHKTPVSVSLLDSNSTDCRLLLLLLLYITTKKKYERPLTLPNLTPCTLSSFFSHAVSRNILRFICIFHKVIWMCSF